MNVIEANIDKATSAHGKPCVSCRKRKVKCDRSRPCANCIRSKQLCTYENSDALKGDLQSPYSDGDLRERLAKLEAMMAAMLMRENSEGRSQEVDFPNALTSRPTAPSVATKTPPPPQPSLSHTLIGSYSSELVNTGASNCVVGQILFQDGYSAYYDSDFWPFLINEVGCPLRSLLKIHYLKYISVGRNELANASIDRRCETSILPA
jgi:hypothetical protein